MVKRTFLPVLTRSLRVVTRGPKFSGTWRDSLTAVVTLSPMSLTISLTALIMVLIVSDICLAWVVVRWRVLAVHVEWGDGGKNGA